MIAALLVVATPRVAGAVVPGDVVISEIMYDPESDQDGDEFLELYNPTGSAVDLTGVCVDGIDFCFGPGASIGAGQYIVLSPDPARTLTTYGVAAAGQYAGGLKNGGETLEVLDAANNVIDVVDYDDNAPWPKTPDGLGPSLELIDPTLDNDDWLNWAASTSAAGHTAGQANSVANSGLGPRITNLTGPASPINPGQPSLVTADIDDATSVTLEYRIDWLATQTVAMVAVGASYQATIPGQSAGDVVRYRVLASNAASTSAVPRVDDSIVYEGVFVADTPVASQLPVLDWRIPQAAYDRLVNDPFSEQFETAVLVYDNVVYDNVQMRVRGSNSRNAPKVSFKVEMPKGHDLDFGTNLAEPVDEFALQADWSDHSHARTNLAWDSYDTAGLPTAQTFKIRVQRNGGYQGLYSYLDIYDGTWRDREGYDTGEFYKAQTSAFDPNQPLEENRWDKKSPKDEDYATLLTLLDGVARPTAAARGDYVLESFDVPKLVNYAAVTSIIEHVDSSSKNFYVYFDTEGTRRWEMIPWDLNHTFGDPCCSVVTDFITPADPADKTNDILDAAFDSPVFVDMYFRRLRTLIDELLATGRYETLLDDLLATYQFNEGALDYAAWPHPNQVAGGRNALRTAFAERRAEYAAAAEVPSSQGVAVSASIAAVEPVGDDAEFIELTTTVASGVDISGWTIPELGFTLQPGSVLASGTSSYVVGDDVTYRSTHGATDVVLGQYGGGLDDGSGTITLRRPNGSIAASFTYGGPGDTPPDTVLTSPSAGATVTSTTVTLAGSAVDDNAVGAVVVLVRNVVTNELLQSDGSFGGFGGAAFLLATLSNQQGGTADWSYQASLPDGSYQVYALAVDTTFQFDPSAAVRTFAVNTAGGPDVVDPDGSIVSPTAFQSVGSPVSIVGEATDNVGVVRVAVAIRDRGTDLWLQSNGSFGAWVQLDASISGPPAAVDWDFVAALPAGNFEVITYVWDAAGNRDLTKARVKFTVT